MKAIVFAALGVAAAGCGSSGGPSPVDGGTFIAITAPEEGATVSIATSSDVPVTFTVEGFVLAAPGLCQAVNDSCGHVHVLVDGEACNASGQIFNNAFPTDGSSASPATAIARLASCPTIAGPHTLRLELHRDDHSAVTGVAAAAIDITAVPAASVDAGISTEGGPSGDGGGSLIDGPG